MSYYENEPQYLAHATTDQMDKTVPVAVTIDSKPEARMEVAQKNNLSPSAVTIESIEERDV